MRILPIILMMIIQLTESGAVTRHRRSVFDVIPTVENPHNVGGEEHQGWRNYEFSSSGAVQPSRSEAVQKRKEILKKLFS